MIAIRVSGLSRVRAALGADYGPTIAVAAQAIAKQIEGELVAPPGPAKHPIQWTSPRQRRWWYAQRGDRGPYKRGESGGQDLLHSWSVARRGATGAVLGSRAGYAAYIHGSKLQQPMHRNTGWITDEQAIRKVVDSGAAKDLVVDAVMGALRRRGYRG